MSLSPANHRQPWSRKETLMKAIRSQIRVASFVAAIVLLLQISPALAEDTLHGRVEVIFLK